MLTPKFTTSEPRLTYSAKGSTTKLHPTMLSRAARHSISSSHCVVVAERARCLIHHPPSPSPRSPTEPTAITTSKGWMAGTAFKMMYSSFYDTWAYFAFSRLPSLWLVQALPQHFIGRLSWGYIWMAFLMMEFSSSSEIRCTGSTYDHFIWAETGAG